MLRRNRFAEAMILLKAAERGDVNTVANHINEFGGQVPEWADRQLLVSAYYVAKGTDQRPVMQLIMAVNGVRSEIMDVVSNPRSKL